ncbi:TraR/DksA family transcriptional regulator [Candidatus Microgenomates bacterium]|nr:TraR/DksA family transcriptional regulator [Candidatus Microgenomates bacterium]
MSKTVKKKTNNHESVGIIQLPRKLVAPIGSFLSDQLARLERRAKDVESDDPFRNVGRLNNNASPDTDAEEQFGHARISAVKGELERKIVQTRKALSRIKIGKYGICESCGHMIDTDRLMVYPEATFCIHCEKKREK